MDIKFIGSSVSAKAILYYITDYITKTPLKTHVAYTALQAAVKRMHESSDTSYTPIDRAKTTLVKCANALIAKQELAAPQVASYLLGFNDHYTSHRFRSLYWTSFTSYIQRTDCIGSTISESSDQAFGTNVIDACAEIPGITGHDVHNEEVVLESNPETGAIQHSCHQLMDYWARDCSLVFNAMCVWDFVASIDKCCIRKSVHSAEDMGDDEQEEIRSNQRVPCSPLSLLHPQHTTL
jgi:hypothetical protein